MRERRAEDREPVAAAAGRARQVDDERRAEDAAAPRERRPCGVFAIESARRACAMPGASRSSTSRVASGSRPRREPRSRRSSARDGRGRELPDRRRDLVALVGTTRRRPRSPRRPAARPGRHRSDPHASRRPLRPDTVSTTQPLRRRLLRLLDQDDVGDPHLLVDRLGHVVDRERRRPKRPSASISTPVCAVVSADATISDRLAHLQRHLDVRERQRGWQSGMSSLVRFAAMIPATLRVASASPFGSSRRIRAVAAAIRTRPGRPPGAAHRLLGADVDHPDGARLVDVRQVVHQADRTVSRSASCSSTHSRMSCARTCSRIASARRRRSAGSSVSAA